jgi:hypothetical protein
MGGAWTRGIAEFTATLRGHGRVWALHGGMGRRRSRYMWFIRGHGRVWTLHGGMDTEVRRRSRYMWFIPSMLSFVITLIFKLANSFLICGFIS